MLEIGNERIVAVEVKDRDVTILKRIDGKIVTEKDSYHPWLLSTEQRNVGANWKELDGKGHKHLACFDTYEEYQRGKNILRKAGVSLVSYNDPIKQYLLTKNRSLFGGMAFQDVRRLQLDIECSTLDPEAKDARILMIALNTNFGRQDVLIGEEEQILLDLQSLIQFWDPDVIEGHNLLMFDLPYIKARAEKNGIANLGMGRDGSGLSIGSERNCPIGPINIAYRKCHVWGRHCVDTLIGTRRFDMAKAELESYGLKEIAIHYKIASEDRVYIDRGKVMEEWEKDPEKVRKYALNDVEETGRLSDLVMPTEFYQTQFLPDSYENVCITGNGEKINSLLVREYLLRGKAVPVSQETREYAGGFTDIRKTGVIHRVVKADVESLYPSIMLRYECKPKTDTENVFLPMLETLTKKRLEAKAKMKEIEKRIQELKNG